MEKKQGTYQYRNKAKRQAYQRDLMRRIRAAAKASKLQSA